MTLKHNSPSEYMVPEYQLSGRPWTTSSVAAAGSVNCHNFHFVTKEFTIFNNASDRLRVGFHDEAFNSGAYFEVPANSCCGPYEIRTVGLTIEGSGSGGDYSILASLTSIPEMNFRKPGGEGVGGEP